MFDLDKSLFYRYQTVFLILLVSAAAYIEPIPAEEVEFLIIPLVATLIFTSLDAIDIQNLSLPSPWLVCLGLLTGYVALPMLGTIVGLILLDGPMRSSLTKNPVAVC